MKRYLPLVQAAYPTLTWAWRPDLLRAEGYARTGDVQRVASLPGDFTDAARIVHDRLSEIMSPISWLNRRPIEDRALAMLEAFLRNTLQEPYRIEA